MSFPVMLAGAAAGTLVLVLIVGELATRAGLSRTGKLLLAGGLGMGVIAVAIKVLVVGLLLETLPAPPVAPAPARPVATDIPGNRHHDSAFRGAWHALPPTAQLSGDTTRNPDRNPDPRLIRLGQQLFDDPRLSATGTVACRTCHRLAQGGDDNSPVATGIHGRQGTRNAPTVWNAAFLRRQFWDGRARTLEAQVSGPLTNPAEMGLASEDAVVATVRSLPGYVETFTAIFGPDRPVTFASIARALAAFERTLVTPDTAYDRFVRGETSALTANQVRGMALFAGLGCRGCHRDPTFSAAGKIRPAGTMKPFPVFADNDYVERYRLLDDRGRANPRNDTPSSTVRGLWRVPSLRNVANTAPYFHNGSVATLEEAVRVMAATQLHRTVQPASAVPPTGSPVTWDPETRRVTPLRPGILTERDIGDLADFLRSLSASDE